MGAIIAIEGGGTHTRAGCYDPDGNLLREAGSGPSNPAAYGIDAAARCIAGIAEALLAGMDPAEVVVYCGLAGVATGEQRQAMADAIGALLRPSRVWVTSDLHALLQANAGGGPGMLVIAGTGAAVLAGNGIGGLVRVGGWGTLLGDEGSAYAVAVSALRACARALDGVGLETVLTMELPREAGLETFADFIGWSGKADKKQIAGLARAVAAAADAGDIMAGSCLEEEARRLAALAVAAREKCGLEARAPLFEHGGMFEHCERYRSAFRTALAQYSEMCPAPCAVRGHAAVHALDRMETSPPWVAVWAGGPASTSATSALPETEQSSRDTPIDRLSPSDLVWRMHAADWEAVEAVGMACAEIARAVERAAAALRAGGRILYVGAGTSGRLGVLDASECPPTFGVSPDRVVGIIAGGERALRSSVEGAEDDPGQGYKDIMAHQIAARDFVVGIAASGNTPYVAGALDAARERGAQTALVTSNRHGSVRADLAIVLQTGPEVLAGSTRLKAGTAAKLVLNMISTGAFAQAGFVYRGRMVGMKPANEKLRLRAVRMIAELSEASGEEAARALDACGGSIMAALVMIRGKLSAEEARRLLDQYGGHLRDALAGLGGDVD